MLVSQASSRVNINHPRVESTGNRVHDSKLSQSVDDVEHHDTHDEETNQHGARAASVQGTTTTDEETSTNTIVTVSKKILHFASLVLCNVDSFRGGWQVTHLPPMAIMLRWRGFMVRSSSTVPEPWS